MAAIWRLPIDRYDDLTDWGDRNSRWIEGAEDLAEQSIFRALIFGRRWIVERNRRCVGEQRPEAFAPEWVVHH